MANQTQTNNVQAKTTWKMIKVPSNVLMYVKTRAQARKMPIWQYVLSCINFYESALDSKIVADVTKAQNNSYYSIKLTMAVTEFIHRTDNRTYENARKIALQVRDRKHVNVDSLLQLIDMYRQRRKKSYARAMTQELIRINVELMAGGSHE